MPSRAEVYDALDTERSYQVDKWGGDKDTTLYNFCQFMDRYLTKALMCHYSGTKGDAETLENIRKITALGVAAMEKFGAPQRKGFEV